jgi:hypothetical protein
LSKDGLWICQRILPLWELFNIKVRARKLLADGAIAADLVKRLGIYLPPSD